MSAHFKEGKFSEGIAEAINAVGAILAKYFPRKRDDRDERSNQVVEE